MKITLCYSMQNAEKAKEAQTTLAGLGHEAVVVKTNDKFVGLSDEEKEELKLRQKYTEDAIVEHYNLITQGDAILVLNYEKHGIPGYIGGNAFLEMGYAYILKKPIFLLNPIPEMPYYKTEIIAMKPIVLDGDLKNISNF